MFDQRKGRRPSAPVATGHRLRGRPLYRPAARRDASRVRSAFPHGKAHTRPAARGSELLSMFKSDEGKWDVGKMASTTKQMSDLYRQFSPLITRIFPK